MGETATQKAQKARGGIGAQGVVGPVIIQPLANFAADTAQHIIVAYRRDGQRAEAGHPKIAGTHTNQAPAAVADFIQLYRVRDDAPQLVQGRPKVDRKAFVGKGMDGHWLVINIAHPRMQALNIQGFSISCDGTHTKDSPFFTWIKNSPKRLSLEAVFFSQVLPVAKSQQRSHFLLF
jgi:hypothetical protein